LDAEKKSNSQPKPSKVQTQGKSLGFLHHLPFLFQRVTQLEPRKNSLLAACLLFIQYTYFIYISFRRVQVNQLIENVKREKEKRKKDSGGSLKKKPIAHRTEEICMCIR
jgi:hypothetical protein